MALYSSIVGMVCLTVMGVAILWSGVDTGLIHTILGSISTIVAGVVGYSIAKEKEA